MPIDINQIPGKHWMHMVRTDIPYPMVTNAYPSMPAGWIYKACIYPNYFENCWYVCLQFKNENGEVELLDDVKDFPSERLKAEIALLTR